MKKYFILIILPVIFLGKTLAQSSMYKWSFYQSFYALRTICDAGDKIYAANSGTLYEYNKQDKSINYYSKITGLSDHSVHKIKYNLDNNILFIVYSNLNIDIIKDNQIYNLIDLKEKQIQGKKVVNDILFYENNAYLSCGFGIIKINLERIEISETYYIGENSSKIEVFDLEIFNGYFYAAAENGIYKADINNPFLIDYLNWEKLHEDNLYIHKQIEVFNNKLFSLRKNISNKSELQGNNDFGVYYIDNNTFTLFEDNISQKANIYSNKKQLLINNVSKLMIYNENLLKIKEYHIAFTSNSLRCNFALLDSNNIVWGADEYIGLLTPNSEGRIIGIIPNGPSSNIVGRIYANNNKIITTKGGRETGAHHNLWNLGVYNVFENNEWRHIVNTKTNDYFIIEPDPKNDNHFFIGSWGDGIFEYLDDQIINHWSYNNSNLETLVENSSYCRISGLKLDKQNNLWSLNSAPIHSLHVISPENKWTSYNLGISELYTEELLLTYNNKIWFSYNRGRGILALDYNNTPHDKSDDKIKKFFPIDNEGKSIGTEVYYLTEDLNNDIWLATDKGLIVYYSPENIFDDNISATHLKITSYVNDTIETHYVFETERVTCIAVDGANRKWIATEGSGVFLVSPDGMETIKNFNVSNSPLPTNNIQSIEIDHRTGEVFFATIYGMVSYKNDATKANPTHTNVLVYPNPVREDYHDIITIEGLIYDANVKITDISGNLVYETTSLGGQAIWDGKNLRGKRVATGVYLIFSSNKDGTETNVAKLLFIN